MTSGRRSARRCIASPQRLPTTRFCALPAGRATRVGTACAGRRRDGNRRCRARADDQEPEPHRGPDDATEAGARVATLPGISEGVFLAGLDADYDLIEQHCEDVLAQVDDAEEIRVTSPQGTDITCRHRFP